MNPDNGGSPAIISAQPMKLNPRKAVAAGMARPASTSSSASSSTDSRSSSR
jgi:hypothetical protein